MPIGPVVRRTFGRYEPKVAEAWRSLFIDLDRFADLVEAWVPQSTRILEVGCGEGAMTQRLAARYPDADILAIDITPRVGRLFQGDASRVTFEQSPVEAVARDKGSVFDLVVLSDVLHHVPVGLRPSILSSIRSSLAPAGFFVCKDWMRASSPIHWLCAASDRYLTGDEVSYLAPSEFRELLEDHFDRGSIAYQDTVPPWRNNQAFLIRAGRPDRP